MLEIKLKSNLNLVKLISSCKKELKLSTFESNVRSTLFKFLHLLKAKSAVFNDLGILVIYLIPDS